MEALKKGQMAVWVAGEKSAFEGVREILNASYSTVMYTGGLGTAMIPKVKWVYARSSFLFLFNLTLL